MLVGASIMGSDLRCIGSESQKATEAGVDFIHIDIMDGHFVPNLTFGPGIIAAINRSTDIFLEVHAMMYNAFDFIETFVASGADRIIVHFEAMENLKEVLTYIKKCGVQAGLAFSPETTLELIPPLLPFCDIVLLMSVQPGFCGQTFLPQTEMKIRFVKQAIRTMQLQCLIEVDGGIDDISAKICRKADADILVAASYFFKDNERTMGEKVLSLRGESIHGVE